MDEINNLLKIIFIISSLLLLADIVSLPMSNCLACELGEDKINGYKAYQEFEEACISYKKPWDTSPIEVPIIHEPVEKKYIYIDIDEVNNYTEE